MPTAAGTEPTAFAMWLVVDTGYTDKNAATPPPPVEAAEGLLMLMPRPDTLCFQSQCLALAMLHGFTGRWEPISGDL
jgi:hypothetical protein